ncbi:MAG: DUF1801 domain-containing protein [Rhizobiaceae bacterium]|nr:DUF1801 domain-containing protein [Rhizobiaceae bacterium]
MRFSHAVRRDPAVDAWFTALTDPHRVMVRGWLDVMRACGDDVRELMHDGCPTACVRDAAFAYVNAFKAHASVGFFQGVALADPAGLLEGAGKRMRHVKLRPGLALDEAALDALVRSAYRDMRQRLAGESEVGMAKSLKDSGAADVSASQKIDARIAELGDWRGETLAKLRAIIRKAIPDVEETWKWRGVPVWESNGIVTTGETYKEVVKLTFAKGAALDDPKRLFNSSLEGNVRRAIDIREGETIDEKALIALVRAAAALNAAKPAKKTRAG